MNRHFLTLALLLAGTGATQAQRPASTIGLTLGYGRTQQLGNNAYSPVGHSAYQGGLLADLYVSKALSFHPEVLYTMQYFDTSNDDDLNRDINYLSVPLLARYHVGGLFVEAGPEVNVALTAKNEAGDNIKSSDVNAVVLDYVAGLGYQFPGGFSLGLRYDGGFTNTFKSNAATTLGRGNFKSSTFWVHVGYVFGSK